MLACAPDVLVLTLGAGIGEGTLSELSALAAQPGWWALPAVQRGEVYIVEPSRFTRPGPRCAQRGAGGGLEGGRSEVLGVRRGSFFGQAQTPIIWDAQMLTK